MLKLGRGLLALVVVGLLGTHTAYCHPPRHPEAQDKGTYSHGEASIKSKVSKQKPIKLPPISLEGESHTTWGAMLKSFSEAIFREETRVDAMAYEAPDLTFAAKLGFREGAEGALVATREALSRVRELSRDFGLTAMLALYEEYLEESKSSRGDLLEESMNALFERTDLAYEQKIGIYLTLDEDLMSHATSSRSLVRLRKLRSVSRSISRLWPGYELGVECVEGDLSYRFRLSSLEPGQAMQGGMIREKYEKIVESAPIVADEGADAVTHTMVDVENLVALAVDRALEAPPEAACGVIAMKKPDPPLHDFVDEAMNDAIWGLGIKDGDFIIDSMARLWAGLEGVRARYGFVASWNDHWKDAPVEKWACQLHVIELLLHEQDRYIDLMHLDRLMSQLFAGSTYYGRLKRHGVCESQLKGEFLTRFQDLRKAHGEAYDWVVQQFAPENAKKLDKTFQSWTKRGKSNVRHAKRLFGFWASWSNGDYERASRYAGDIIEKRARIAHPQLHSLNIVLSAYRGETWPREDVNAYIRVLRLKFPSLPYDAFREAYGWMKPEQRTMVAEVMRTYDPSFASHAAASFFETYANELRVGMNAAHRVAIDAWMDFELRSGESALETNRRRLTWFKDLHDSEDWSGLERLSRVGVAEAPNALWRSFWKMAGDCAHARRTGVLPEALSDWDWGDCHLRVDEKLSPQSWLQRASRCF